MKCLLVLIITSALNTLTGSNGLAQSFNQKNFSMTIQGTSSLHDWESSVEKVETKGSYTIENNALTDVSSVVLKIPVTSIKSTKGKTMDNKTFEAFEYLKHPNITFTLKTKKISAVNAKIDLTGNLTMAGVTNPVELPVEYKVLPNGDLQIKGSKKIKMTSFNMKPPTAVLGTIKVGDEVVIVFDLTLTKSDVITQSK